MDDEERLVRLPGGVDVSFRKVQDLDLWVMETPVTVQQWWALKGGEAPRAAGDPWSPVTGVSWREALSFAEALGAHTGQGAAVRWGGAPRWRGGGGVRMPFEWELQHLLSTAPSDGHFQPGATGPRDVRKGTRDRHGLLDLRGNVWEWCLDAWSERPPTRLTGAAIEAHLDESESARRVVRGGGWDVEATLCLARVWADAASAGIGLRLVADAGDGAPGWIPDELAEARRWVGQLNPANRHACLRAGGVLGADDIDRYQGGVNAIRAYLATHHPAVLRR